MRALELFSGIGGFAAAAAGFHAEVAGAVDQSREALAVYRRNFPAHETLCTNLERIAAGRLAAFEAELWWLSPPCQPYCIRGASGDLHDPRSGSLLNLLQVLSVMPDRSLPRHIALENVPGFAASSARIRVLKVLSGRGFHTREVLLCPTELGVPSRRPRYYLAASLEPLSSEKVASGAGRPLAGYLGAGLRYYPEESLRVPKPVLARFGNGLRVLESDDPLSYTTCFTSGYGRSVMHAGSYLRCSDGARYFTPEEIALLLHFPPSFSFPPDMPLRTRWRLIGNSLSVAAVTTILDMFPQLRKAAPS